MPAFASAALTAAVALSAIGAVALCVLVVLYGFTPTGEEPPGEAPRRLIITRVGHALAATCFTATAILIATVLVRASPPPTAAPDARVPALGRKIAGQETRLSETERRLQEIENAVRRRNVEATPPVATAPAAFETPGSARRATAPKKPERPRDIAAPRTADPPSPAASIASSRPVERSVSSTPPAASTPRVAASAPPATQVPAFPPPPVVTSPPPVTAPPNAPPPSIAASPRPTPPETAAPPGRPAPRQGFDLGSKLREDWREIRRGVDSGEDDFRRALEDVKRNLGLGN